MTYDFATQYDQGVQGETDLDTFFSQWFTVAPVCRADQRRGIDRSFTDRRTGYIFTVEYKTDRRAQRTGNAFIETVSVDRPPVRRGWVYTCQANYLVYFCPTPDTIYILSPAVLRSAVDDWTRHYPIRIIPNHGYNTHGLLVPLHELEKIAIKVY